MAAKINKQRRKHKETRATKRRPMQSSASNLDASHSKARLTHNRLSASNFNHADSCGDCRHFRRLARADDLWSFAALVAKTLLEALFGARALCSALLATCVLFARCKLVVVVFACSDLCGGAALASEQAFAERPLFGCLSGLTRRGGKQRSRARFASRSTRAEIAFANLFKVARSKLDACLSASLRASDSALDFWKKRARF